MACKHRRPTADPARLLPGVAGGSNLLPAYDSLSTTISEVDDETIIFYEPVTWGVVLPNSSAGTGTGFSRAPNAIARRRTKKRRRSSKRLVFW